jgi:hypothetical protein
MKEMLQLKDINKSLNKTQRNNGAEKKRFLISKTLDGHQPPDLRPTR